MDLSPRPCRSGWRGDPAEQPHHRTAHTLRRSPTARRYLPVVHSGRSHTLDSCRPAVSVRRVDTSWVVRKIRQLDGDVMSLYELLTDISTTQAAHGERLDALDDRVSRLDDRVSRLDDRVSRLDDRVSQLDDRLSQLDDRVSRLDDRLSQLDDRLSRLDDKVDRIEGKLDRIIGLLSL